MISETDRGRVARLLARPARSGENGRHVERLPLPVPVRGRGEPGGVPLEAILAAAQEVSPTVTGLAVSGGEVTVTHRERPPEAERERLRGLLGDPERLLALSPPSAAAQPSGNELLAVLRDEATPDAEWMRLFRRWAVAELIDRGGGA
ncbi:hypothetical protein ACIBQ1_24095 [Nonomuraea sp. NPDC050153]|uniref:hypothetical protein n=1 Tax=Nonomuraea sp. NPDC050153 TaxID=3364359 RepID=UPI0037AAC855